MLGTPFSFSFFSTLHAQSVIAPHSGPSNLRLRCHLPLIVPKAGGTAGGKEGGSRPLPGGASSSFPSSSSPLVDEYESLEDIQAAVPCGICIGDQVRAWEEGKCLVFDDAYEHSVWNRTEEERVLLLVDFWHVSFCFSFFLRFNCSLTFCLGCGQERREGGREGGREGDFGWRRY